jgi:hypothetical protein
MRKMNNWPEQSIVIEKEEEKAQSPLSSRERPRTPPATYSPINQLGKQVKTKVQINAESAKKISFWLNLTGGIIGASAGFYATALKMSRT